MKYFFLLISLIGLVACNTEGEGPLPAVDPNAQEQAPTDATLVGQGAFESYAHSLGGKAILYQREGTHVVRLENFTMTPGPDVYVFLSKTNNYSKANAVEVVRLKEGYNMSAINLEFNSALIGTEHRFVLIYCVQYNSLFGYAELK